MLAINVRERWAAALSTVGLVAAAGASLATSPPPPDWTLSADAEGDFVLAPDASEATFRVRASAKVVAANLSLSASLVPAPELKGSLGATPIVLFVSAPRAEGDVSAGAPRYTAIPPSTNPVNETLGAPEGVPAGTMDRVYTVRIAWDSPNVADYETQTYTERGSNLETRPVAVRRPTTVHLKATLTASGYDDRPAGAAVTLERAP